MFSRLALRNCAPKGILGTRQAQTSTSNISFDGPERDLVNFPRPERPMYSPKTRLGFIPETWFKAFYNKTGVTGPYMFGISLGTYLVSKEIYVLEHEFYTGLSIVVMCYIAVTKLGPPFSKYLDGEIDKLANEYDQARENSIKGCADGIEDEKKEQWRAEGQSMLIEAKRENVALQLEAAYRERVMKVYNEIRKRLDFQAEKDNINRRISQKNLVEFVTQNVLKSISAQQETDALKKCIADLNGLAAAVNK